MKAALLLYLKAFLLTGIPFGIFMSLFDLLAGQFSIDKFIYTTCFFGTGMSVLIVTIQLLGLKRLGIKNFTSQNLAVKQSKPVHASVGKEILVAKLKSDPFISKMKLTEKEETLELTSDVSLWSWGETISIKPNPSMGTNEYEIESKPKLKITLADFGRNMKNVRRIEKLIS